MKLIFLYVTTALMVAVNVFSQSQDSIQIRGNFREDVCSSSLIFTSFSENFTPLVETVIVNNSFCLSLPATIAPGVYRLQYNQDCGGQFVNIIINGMDREISFILNRDNELPIFVGSKENDLWNSYKKQNRRQVFKLGFLYNFLSFYPVAEDEVVQKVIEAVSKEREKYYDNFESFVKSNKGTWAAKMVANQPYYFSGPKIVPTLRDFVQRGHYWEGINTNDPKLINSPLYPTLIDKYLDFDKVKDYNALELEDYFNRSATVIMEKFSHNKETESFAKAYLKEKHREMSAY